MFRKSQNPKKRIGQNRSVSKISRVTLILPLLANLHCGGYQKAMPVNPNDGGSISCSEIQPQTRVLEKDFRKGESLEIGQGIGAGCNTLTIYISSDKCGEEGGPHANLVLRNKEGHIISLNSDKREGGYYYYYNEGDPITQVIQLGPVNGEAAPELREWFDPLKLPAYLIIEEKTYKIELIRAYPVLKMARIRITDISEGSDLAERIGEETACDTLLSDLDLEGSAVVTKILYKTTRSIPDQNQILTFDYTNGEGRLYVLDIQKNEGKEPIVRLAIETRYSGIYNIYAQACSWINFPCAYWDTEYKFYIGRVNTDGPAENWNVELGIYHL